MRREFVLPKFRKVITPDSGYIICDVDLDRADAQIVAWDAGDEPLKKIFRDRLDLHTMNAIDLFGPYEGEGEHPKRPLAKAGVHAVNYLVKARTLASTLGISIAEAQYFIDRWYAMHPAIPEWHERVDEDMQRKRKISNVFGFSIPVLDRLSFKLLQEMVAWIAQSSVAHICDMMWENIDLLEDETGGDIRCMLQVHDSVVFQVKQAKLFNLLPEIHRRCLIEVPYEDPLTIPVGIKWSEKSWGDVQEHNWLEAA